MIRVKKIAHATYSAGLNSGDNVFNRERGAP
jgi:hypothetical protein